MASPDVPKSEELEMCEDKVTTLLKEIEQVTTSAKRLKGRERMAKIDDARERLSRARTGLKAYRIELRYLEASDNEQCKAKIKSWEDRMDQLAADIEYVEKDDLTGDARMRPESMSADQNLQRAAAIQGETIEVVRDMIMTTDESKRVGVETLEAMGTQREKLENARSAVKHMESEMALAGKQIRVFAKHMVTDKLILGVFVVIMIVVVIIVVIAAAKPAVKKYSDTSNWSKVRR